MQCQGLCLFAAGDAGYLYRDRDRDHGQDVLCFDVGSMHFLGACTFGMHTEEGAAQVVQGGGRGLLWQFGACGMRPNTTWPGQQQLIPNNCSVNAKRLRLPVDKD